MRKQKKQNEAMSQNGESQNEESQSEVLQENVRAVKIKNQQQILFAEDDLLSTGNNNIDSALVSNEQQIIFDNQDWQPNQQTALLQAELEQDEVNVQSKPRWAWRIVLALTSIMLIAQMVDFFVTGFVQSPISTSIWAIIASMLALLSGSALWREYSALRQFKGQQKLKQQALAVYQDESTIDVRKFCQDITTKLPSDLLTDDEQKKWLEVLDGDYSSAELLHLYSKLILVKVDQKAMEEVATFSTEAVVLVSLSPVAIVDMMIIFWRNLRMINKVAGLYGLQLGYWSRIKLIKQVFINMAYAGASELVADFGSEMLGADLLGKLSARLAQGLGAGLLTARLGLKTIQVCRPMPYEDNAPKLNHVRKQIISKIKGLINK